MLVPTSSSRARRGFIRGLSTLSIVAFSIPFAIAGLVLAADCYETADPLECCNVVGLHHCSSGGTNWTCADTNNGPFEEPRVSVGTTGKDSVGDGPPQVCVIQKRKCSTVVNQCLNDGNPIANSCAGLVPKGADCDGGGGGT